MGPDRPAAVVRLPLWCSGRVRPRAGLYACGGGLVTCVPRGGWAEMVAAEAVALLLLFVLVVGALAISRAVRSRRRGRG